MYGKRSGFDCVVEMAKRRIVVDRWRRLLDQNENIFAICRDLANNYGYSWPEGWIDRHTGRLRKSVNLDLNSTFDYSWTRAFVDDEKKIEPSRLSATILKPLDRRQTATH